MIDQSVRRDILDFLMMRETMEISLGSFLGRDSGKPTRRTRVPFHGDMELTAFLRRVWLIDEMPSTDIRFETAAQDIEKHMVLNSDWTEEYLLVRYLDLMGCEDGVFLKFMEQTLHPLVLKDANLVMEAVAYYNSTLAQSGYAFEVGETRLEKPIYKTVEVPQHTYEVVLSYAGEDREYVEKVAKFLEAAGVRLFYAPSREAELWGKDMFEQLDRIYRKDARFCIMFVSEHYAKKMWPTHERRSSFARSMEEQEEYVLPVRFDDTNVPGLRPTVHYFDARRRQPPELARLVLAKLGRAQAE